MDFDPRLFEEDLSLEPSSDGKKIFRGQQLELDFSGQLSSFELAYETWGSLNSDRSNAILVCHALTGDSHAIGWWDRIVGPGKVLDTDRFFVVCSNVLGGCQGSSGPTSLDLDGNPLGKRFPLISVPDMVRAQNKLREFLGIEEWFLVCGGSMGGMQALEWAIQVPDATPRVWMTASCDRHSAMQIGFNEIGRQAILRDPEFVQNGTSFHGLAVARMMGHMSYLSPASFERKFGRNLQDKDKFCYNLDKEFAIESYLNYQGEKFTSRFDPYAYIVLTKAIDYYEASLSQLKSTVFLLTSFESDLLYLPTQSESLNARLNENGITSTHECLDISFGHDSFLLDDKLQVDALVKFLERT